MCLRYTTFWLEFFLLNDDDALNPISSECRSCAAILLVCTSRQGHVSVDRDGCIFSLLKISFGVGHRDPQPATLRRQKQKMTTVQNSYSEPTSEAPQATTLTRKKVTTLRRQQKVTTL